MKDSSAFRLIPRAVESLPSMFLTVLKLFLQAVVLLKRGEHEHVLGFFCCPCIILQVI